MITETTNITEEEIDNYLKDLGAIDQKKFVSAVNDNILIFDPKAKKGEFTAFVLGIANQIAVTYDDYLSPIKKVYLHTDLVDKIYLEYKKDGLHENLNYLNHVFGLPYGTYNNKLIDLFYDLGLTLANEDKYLIIFELENGKYLLGSC